MKYKVITGIIGASVMLASLSGCGSKKEVTETELPTLSIMDMEVIVETESETESETETAAELPTLQETESETAELTLGKPDGGADAADLSEEPQIILDETEEKEPESQSVQTDSEKIREGKPGGPEPQMEQTSPVKEQTEKQTKEQTEKQTEGQIKEQTEKQTEKKQEKQTEKRAGKQTEKNRGQASQSQTEEIGTEDETEINAAEDSRTAGQSAVMPGQMTETESEPESEQSEETESEPEHVPAAGTGESEQTSEPERMTETESVTGLRVIKEGNINVRKSPSTEAEIISSLSPGMNVYALGASSDWTHICFEGITEIEDGYVKTEFLGEPQDFYSVKETINLREEPSTEAEKLGMLSAGDVVFVEEQGSDGWVRIQFTEDTETKEAYVRSEFLEPADFSTFGGRILAEGERRLAEGDGGETILPEGTQETESETEPETATEPETEPETAAETEEPETESETVTATEPETVAETEEPETEPETAAETEEPETESEIVTATEPETEPETATEPETEPETAAETEPETVTETESETEPETEQETATEPETEPETAAETETDTETELTTEADSETETESEEMFETLPEEAEDAERQLALLMSLYSEAKSVGIIYSADNTAAAAQIEDYETYAAKYGVELVTSEIKEDIDIDLVASEMAGTADAILCMEDPLVNELLQTVCAYANEVGIPVIGMEQQQIKQGCLAACEGGELFWNPEEAEILGLDTEAPTL